MKKQHFSENSQSKNSPGDTKDGPENQENLSPFLDENYCRPHISEIVMHQNNTIALDSLLRMDNKSPDVCKKLNDNFDEVENFPSDLHTLSNSYLENDFSEELQSQVENVKGNITCKVSKLLCLECDKMFEKVSLKENVHHVDFVNTDYQGKELTKKATHQNFNNMPHSTNNGLNISMKSLTSLADGQLQRNSQKDGDLTVSPKPLRKLDSSLPHAIHSNFSTEQDQKCIVKFDYDHECRIVHRTDCKTVEDAATPIGSEIENDFMKPDNIPKLSCHGVTSLDSKIDSPSGDLNQMKSTTEMSYIPPGNYQLHTTHNDHTERKNKHMSNKENVRTDARKKVVILLSDSDSDSVWEDGQESDDSDCGKYDISLSSRLVKDLSNEKTSNAIKATCAGFIKTAGYVIA